MTRGHVPNPTSVRYKFGLGALGAAMANVQMRKTYDVVEWGHMAATYFMMGVRNRYHNKDLTMASIVATKIPSPHPYLASSLYWPYCLSSNGLWRGRPRYPSPSLPNPWPFHEVQCPPTAYRAAIRRRGCCLGLPLPKASSAKRGVHNNRWH